MKDGLAGVGPGVDHEAPSSLLEPLLVGDPPGNGDEAAHGVAIGVGEIVEPGDVTLRNDEDVDRSLRVQVAKRDGPFVLEDAIRRNRPGGDATEDAVGHGLARRSPDADRPESWPLR